MENIEVSSPLVSSKETDRRTVNLFTAIDDGFAMPLAVALYSALQNMRAVDRVQIVVADMGIESENRDRISRVVANAPFESSLEFVVPDIEAIAGFPTSEWHKVGTYVRLLMGRILPDEWDRVVYLDGDVLVQGDLGRLWERDMNGNIALGVQDFRNPTVMHRLSLRDVYLRDLNLNPDDAYCWVGMMKVDLDAWRDERIGEQCLAFLQQYGESAEYKDQDAINGILRGRWGILEPSWHVALSALQYYGYPEHQSLQNREHQDALKRDVKVVHFSGASKPWHFLYRRPMSREFFNVLMNTGWFPRWKERLWIWPRRFLHSVLRSVPESVLTRARRAVEKLRGQANG